MSVGFALCSHLVPECLKASFRTKAQADNSFCEAQTFTKAKTPFRCAPLKKGSPCIVHFVFEPVGRCFFL